MRHPASAALTEPSPGSLTRWEGEALPVGGGEHAGGLSPHMAIYLEFIQGAAIPVNLTEPHELFESKKSPLAGGRRGAQTQAGLGGLGLPVLAW